MDEEYIIIKKSMYIEMPEIVPESPKALETPEIVVEMPQKEEKEEKEEKELSGFEMISISNLSEDQKKLAKYIYDSAKQSIQSFMSDNSLNNTIKITMMLGQIIKQIETVKICGKAPTGSDKKAIVIQIGHILLKEINQPEIVIIYDIIADQTLETIIDVSKVVNVYVKEIATSCCPNFFKRK